MRLRAVSSATGGARRLAIAVGALVVVVASGAGPATADPETPGPAEPRSARRPCPPAARLTGDPELVRAVALELSLLGVAQAAEPGCAAIEVRVSRAGDTLAIDLRDRVGGRATHVATNAHVAAGWIQSWVHPEIAAPLLAAREGDVGGRGSAGGIPGIEDRGPRGSPARAASAPAERALPRLRIALAAEVLHADDDTWWRGLGARGCARLWWICVGLSAHLAGHSDFYTNDSRSLASRRSAELLGGFSAPLSVGQMTLEPSVGAGLGYLRTTRSGPCRCGVTVDDGFAPGGFGLRFGAGLHASFAIAGPIRLSLAASWSVAPGAHTDAFLPRYARDYFQHGVVPPGGPLVNNAEIYALPGEPSRVIRLGIGLGAVL